MIVSLFLSISVIEENNDHLKWDKDMKYGYPGLQTAHELSYVEAGLLNWFPRDLHE